MARGDVVLLFCSLECQEVEFTQEARALDPHVLSLLVGIDINLFVSAVINDWEGILAICQAG